MNKAFKIILIIIAALVLLLIVAVVAAKMYFTSERLMAMVIPKVEQATGKHVEVGSISLSVFPKLSVKMKGLVVANAPDAPFDRPDLASLEELTLDVSLRPLLQREVQVQKIVLNKPSVYLEVNKEGLTNYAMPQVEAETSTQSQPQARPQFALLVPDLRIIDGHIEYVDKKVDQRIIADGLNQNMSVNVTDGGTRAAIEGRSSIDSLSLGTLTSFFLKRLPISSYQKLSYNMLQDRLTLDSVGIAIEQISLAAHGTVERMQTTPIVDLSVRSTEADLGQLLSLVPKEFLKASQGLKTGGTFQFALTAKGQADSLHQPAVAGTFSVNNGSIQYQGLPKAVTGINFAGAFDRPAGTVAQPAPGQLTIDRLTANLGTSQLTGNLKVNNFMDPVIAAAFDGDVNLGEVKDYYPLEKGTELAGQLKAHVALNGKAKDPTGLKAEGRMDLLNVMVQSPASERPLRNLNGTITFDNQVVNAKNLSVNVGESDMELTFSMRNYLGLVMKNAAPSGKPTMNATLTSNQLRTADLPQAKKEPGAAPATKSEGPVLPDIDIAANVTIGKLITEKFQFDNVRGAVRIKGGVITLENFSTNAFNGSISSRGMISLNPENRAFDLNLNLNSLEANTALTKFTRFGNYLFGQFNLTGDMKGNLNDTLGLDTQTLAGQGKVTINQGKLEGLPLTSQLASFTGVPNFQQINFSDWSNTFKIAAGKLELPDLKIKAGNTDIMVSGFQGLDGKLDYRMTLRIPPELIGQLKIGGVGSELLNFMKDQDGKISLPLIVRGTMTSPAFSFDQAQIQAKAMQAIQQQARAKVDTTKEQLKQKAQEELEKLFKRK